MNSNVRSPGPTPQNKPKKNYTIPLCCSFKKIYITFNGFIKYSNMNNKYMAYFCYIYSQIDGFREN